MHSDLAIYTHTTYVSIYHIFTYKRLNECHIFYFSSHRIHFFLTYFNFSCWLPLLLMFPFLSFGFRSQKFLIYAVIINVMRLTTFERSLLYIPAFNNVVEMLEKCRRNQMPATVLLCVSLYALVRTCVCVSSV